MAELIVISEDLVLSTDDIEIQAIRAQGAGGQNVNKVATAIHLRFDYENCMALPDPIRDRLSKLDDSRITSNGIVIKSQEHRTQSRNRQAAIERLKALIQSVLVKPKRRIPTKPSKKAKQNRIDAKRRTAQLKKNRGRVTDD
ncbi:MAG: aminoacyl-tRNA hydrolase [Gammaproteobacteria bacterium]|nr:aminoacyl-tRNA hydrolase [Gammaproteobacteria bacterium]